MNDFSRPEEIKRFLDNGVGLETEMPDGTRPIHLIIRYSTPEMIKRIIDKGVDLEAIANGWRPIHLACRYSTPEAIKYLIDKGVDLESMATPRLVKPDHIISPELANWANMTSKAGKAGMRPIHIICQFMPEMIEYIADKGVNLEARDSQGWRPIHIVSKYGSTIALKYLVSKGVYTDVTANGRTLLDICARRNVPYLLKLKIKRVFGLAKTPPLPVLKSGSYVEMLREAADGGHLTDHTMSHWNRTMKAIHKQSLAVHV